MVCSCGRHVLLEVFIIGEIVVEGADRSIPEESVTCLGVEALEVNVVDAALVSGLRGMCCRCPDNCWCLVHEGMTHYWVQARWYGALRDGCRPRDLPAGKQKEAVCLGGLRGECDLEAVRYGGVGEVGAGFNGVVVKFG